jgi:cytochrome c-type biogenesis protein CcmH
MGLIGVAAIVAGWGSEPTTGTSDDRMFRLSEQLRCLQCTGESVANSQAPIAIQMRDEIRRQMARGRTNDEIITFFADRYGSRVLLNPSGSGLTSLIWVLPVVVGAMAFVGVGVTFTRSRRRAGIGEASAEDTALVEAALAGRDDPGGR